MQFLGLGKSYIYKILTKGIYSSKKKRGNYCYHIDYKDYSNQQYLRVVYLFSLEDTPLLFLGKNILLSTRL